MTTPAAAPATPPAPPAPDLSIPILPHTIGEPEPTPPPPEPAAPSADERLAALEAQIAAQQAQNAQLLQALAQRPMVAPQPTAPPPALPDFTLEGLPDAVSAPADFTRQLQQRIQQRDQQLGQYLTHNITQQVARGAALDGLYNRFSIQQPELAKRQALLQGAASVVFNQLRQQGMDPADIAMQNPDSLIASIAQRMTQELGVAPQPGGSPTANGFVMHGAPMTPASPPTSAARTTGIAAGSPSPRPPAAPAAPPGFVAQLNAARKADGLI